MPRIATKISMSLENLIIFLNVKKKLFGKPAFMTIRINQVKHVHRKSKMEKFNEKIYI